MGLNAISTGILGAIGLGALVLGLIWLLRRMDRPARNQPSGPGATDKRDPPLG